ncbi:hypothetical protein R3P38DRAFT_2800913 [Favolaschia claudopus]|uniref:Uncharacterized protein n=1 Tax=Favolaschia claudopus TaxID=2862362 RepID=A0AAV9Z3R7_9AGAR
MPSRRALPLLFLSIAPSAACLTTVKYTLTDYEQSFLNSRLGDGTYVDHWHLENRPLTSEYEAEIEERKPVVELRDESQSNSQDSAEVLDCELELDLEVSMLRSRLEIALGRPKYAISGSSRTGRGGVNPTARGT